MSDAPRLMRIADLVCAAPPHLVRCPRSNGRFIMHCLAEVTVIDLNTELAWCREHAASLYV